KYWVRPIFSIERRSQQGASENLVKEMQIGDTEKYVDYFRMSPQLFEALLQLVGPILTKESSQEIPYNPSKQYFIRDPILSKTRLQITLRYLAGDSMKSLSDASELDTIHTHIRRDQRNPQKK
ncbi:hypothetical protein ALC62_02742, partial [Cyphomyrmex costatus]